ncbi:alpha/beta hydrolase [Motilimonas eburnea]|uniref:alpha/beta hydrolase n=1 Tax=Motilimonas eburnea TaxID=1737488 RepID=UPI001E2E9AA5|nr:alpha/beta fold hydrolase [Motilimonas eburnea]MCE2570213.1 alpha/beta fold hydrolase [Motilimonas eburnea]
MLLNSTRKVFQTGLLLVGFTVALSTQVIADALPQGEVLNIQVAAPTLKGNLTDEQEVRETYVYLPPSYHSKPQKRYPVVYFLHGFGGNAQAWFSTQNPSDPATHKAMDELIAQQQVQEMILVAADTTTKHIGSWYINSPITGNWQDFITQDLITAIDQQFRTLAKAESRALLGHSMGGMGAFTIAFAQPKLFSTVVGMSPATYLLAPTSPDEIYQFYSNVKPQLDNMLTKPIDGSAHFFLSLAQPYLGDRSNPPSYIKPNLQSTDFAELARFNLLDLAKRAPEQAKKINYYSEMGTEDMIPGGYTTYEQTMKQIQQAGYNLQFASFKGGHTDKFNERVYPALKFVNQHLISTP